MERYVLNLFGVAEPKRVSNRSWRSPIEMIRPSANKDLEGICAVINDGAQAYRGVIPADRWTDPYMPIDELRREIESGVMFYVFEDRGEIHGVMGMQTVRDVTLVRHAYVSTRNQKRGIGGRLLTRLRELTEAPVLIGTWANATWAIQFYERHGFRMVGDQMKEHLLRTYWAIPDRQVETSVVLADQAAWRHFGEKAG